jgi:hypothetical protein
MLKMTWNSFPFIPVCSNLLHKPTIQILSKDAEKSMNEQKSFFFLALNLSIRSFNIKIWPDVE